MIASTLPPMPTPRTPRRNGNPLLTNDAVDHVDNPIDCADVSCVRLVAVDFEIIVWTSLQRDRVSVHIISVLGATAATVEVTRGQFRTFDNLYDVSLDERLGIFENAFRLVVAHCRKYCVVGRREYREEIAVVAKRRLNAGVHHQASVEAEPRFHVQGLQEIVRTGRRNEDFVDNVNDTVAGWDIGPLHATAFDRLYLWTKVGKQSFVVGGGVDSIAILVSGGYAVGIVGGFMSHELARAVCVSLVVATIVLS